MGKFNEILDTLAAHKIKYYYRIIGQTKYVYIHKKDVERLPKL